MAELGRVSKLKCQNPQRLILLLARSCDRRWRLAARVCAWEQKERNNTKAWKMKPNVDAFAWMSSRGRRTKHTCDCTRTCSREGARGLLGDLWFYRLTALWPDKKWFPAPSSVCCQFSCPSKLPCPPVLPVGLYEAQNPGSTAHDTRYKFIFTHASHKGNETRPTLTAGKTAVTAEPSSENKVPQGRPQAIFCLLTGQRGLSMLICRWMSFFLGCLKAFDL